MPVNAPAPVADILPRPMEPRTPPSHAPTPAEGADAWWARPLALLQHELDFSGTGLPTEVAAARLVRDGPNVLGTQERWPLALQFAARLANPLVAVLIAASVLAALLGDNVSSALVAVVVLLSVGLDVVQEHRAGRAVQALQERVALKAQVWRDGLLCEVPAAALVRGDVVQLAAGSLVPADGRLLEARDLFVNQASLSGEAFPVAKRAGDDIGRGDARADAARDPLQSAVALWMGSSMVSGSARLLVCAVGAGTMLGRTAHSLAEPAPPTAFERGTRQFGLLLTRLTIALVLFVLMAAAFRHRPLLEALLFAVALAVGLTPELLPMIVSVTLARGALRLARKEVIVKRLGAIEDLGAMDVLCTDKTGTLTEARIRLAQHVDAEGQPSPWVLELAWLNSHFESGLRSPLDDAIVQHATPAAAQGWRKLDELPFDFERRRVSVLVQRQGLRRLVVKGAPEDVLAVSARVMRDGRPCLLDEALRREIGARIEAFGRQGLRVLGVALREEGAGDDAMHRPIEVGDEHELVFAGLLAFIDPPKAGAAQALRSLAALGVACKIITGDNEAVTQHLAGALGLPVHGVLHGHEIARMDEQALQAAAVRANLFCRVTPEQKQRLVRALAARGHVVGFMGDGVNDASALRAADVGISVHGAVDVARQAADLVLLRHDLAVLREGVLEGRRTFANVMKYITMATSSNFGNMLSMAAAALVVPFLPMLPTQILLNNFLYDLSEVVLPLDRVDALALRRPQRWDMGYIRDFMLVFGGLSSLFDLLAFALLLAVLHAAEARFQTGWFMASMATQILVVFVIRTRGAAWRSRPSRWLWAAALGTVTLSWLLPFSAFAPWFGFEPLPPAWLAMLAGLTLTYLASAELAKRLFHRLHGRRRGVHRGPHSPLPTHRPRHGRAPS